MGIDQQAKDVRTHFARTTLLVPAGALVVIVLAFRLREVPFLMEPSLLASLNIIGVFLSITIAANAMVRFRGTRDLMVLVLALGFISAAGIELGVTLEMFGHLTNSSGWLGHIGFFGIQARMLLAEALLLSAAVGQPMRHAAIGPWPPFARLWSLPRLVVAGTVIYLGGTFVFAISGEPNILANGLIPRPWNIVPAILYALAALALRRRVRQTSSALDHALVMAAWMNVACHLLTLESARMLDAQSAISQVIRIGSYAMILGGTLVDNSRLFTQVQQLAVSDPLTGLSNYRRLVDVLESEVERSNRTGREFSVVLLDLDGLKLINDQYGHLVGSRALCRLAEILRCNSRSMDTPSRYGGDEFAIVLPEIDKSSALRVADRIRTSLASHVEHPRLSVSTGVAVYPADGVTAESLLAAADRALYAMKFGLRSPAARST